MCLGGVVFLKDCKQIAENWKQIFENWKKSSTYRTNFGFTNIELKVFCFRVTAFHFFQMDLYVVLENMKIIQIQIKWWYVEFRQFETLKFKYIFHMVTYCTQVKNVWQSFQIWVILYSTCSVFLETGCIVPWTIRKCQYDSDI